MIRRRPPHCRSPRISPHSGIVADYKGLLAQRAFNQPNPSLEVRRFATLEEYVRATGQDQHSLTLDYDIFLNVPRLSAQDLKSVQKLYKAEDLDFRLKPGSAAIDRGMPLPNVTDVFTGKAPDLGALELDQPPPHYGPRR